MFPRFSRNLNRSVLVTLVKSGSFEVTSVRISPVQKTVCLPPSMNWKREHFHLFFPFLTPFNLLHWGSAAH